MAPVALTLSIVAIILVMFSLCVSMVLFSKFKLLDVMFGKRVEELGQSITTIDERLKTTFEELGRQLNLGGQAGPGAPSNPGPVPDPVPPPQES
jgi:hypothetical protein